jgi:NADH:ubiquinone oxidoreductase subunit H
LYGEQARAGAHRALDSLGIILAESHPSTGGLRIASVLAGGSAEQAGIGANDVLTAVDGLTILALDDLNLPSHTRTARVAVTRNDITDDRVLELQGYATSSPTDQLATFVALLLASIVIFSALKPRAGVVTSLSRQIHLAFASSTRTGFAQWLRARTRELVRGNTRAEIVPWMVLAAPATSIGLAPFVPSLVRLNWDIGLLFAVGGALRLCASPTVSFAGALQGIPTSLAAICALVTSVIASGTFRAEGVVAAQSGLPWGWHAFRSPASFVLAALFLVALAAGAPEHHEPQGATPRSADPSQPSIRTMLVRNIVGWSGTLLFSLAGVTALFGGWQLPFTELNEQDGSALIQMLAAVLFVAKAWCLTLTTAWYRWAVSASRTRAIVQRAGQTIIGLSLLSAALHSLYVVLVARLPAAVSLVIAQGTFALVCVSLLGAVTRPYFIRSVKLQHPYEVQFTSLSTQHSDDDAQ